MYHCFPNQGEDMPNPVMQFQILSKTPDDTALFYTTLFGWKVDANNPMGYRRLDTGSKEGIQGGIWPAPPQASSFVQLFISVDDVKSSVQKAEGLGAKMIIPPTVLPEGDEMAVLLDPQGMSFAVWRQKKV
jgi:predicted enzyme related to lactoylglutathione lyase